MLLEPTLQVRELAVHRGSGYAYRASFHNGINVISGENSSGKSTILSLLVYGLGADIASWSEHALLCERVSVGVELNGKPVTLSRLISKQLGQPMDVFPGNFEQSQAAPISEWLRFPYRTSASKQSFSQAVFHQLNIPELETEASGKLTLHQVFRLLYSDQLSPVEKIFRSESFDSPALREAVGRLLFGAYDADIYSNQLRIRELEKELATVEAALRSIYTLLAGVNHSLTLDWVEAERRNLEAKIAALSDEIVAAESHVFSEDSVDQPSLRPQQQALMDVQRVQSELAEVEEREQAVRLEAADSAMFIATLERKISSLQDSQTIALAVSEVSYAWCPSCFAPLHADDNPGACRLCKEPFDEERLKRRIVLQLNEMIIQLKESRTIQAERSRELEDLARRRVEAQARWEAARQSLTRIRRTPTSDARNLLRQLNERYGYMQREMEGLAEKADLIRRLDEMSSQKVSLRAGIEELSDANARLKAAEATRLAKAYSSVAAETVDLLHNDLPRQDSFEQAESIDFSFAKDEISVDGQSYFSASSTVYLKNAFLCAFLFAAAKNAQFRHFRIAILDTIEDKGMEPDRSKNFQNLLVERSSVIDAEHQIIFATAMISDKVNMDDFVVGRHSTHEDRTLQV